MAEPAIPTAIERRLGAFDTAMVVVSLVIGIGIFRSPAIVAAHAGTVGAFYLAWLMGGAISLCGALTYAEIGSRLPRAGGQYRAVAEAYHPIAAFMLTWSQAVLQGAGAAGVAFIGAEYLNLVLLPAGARTHAAMMATADAEDKTDKSAVTPGPLAPARELLGFMLLEAGKPQEALVAFEAVMKKEPNRFLALYGGAQAAEKLKQTAKAKGYYQQIVEICKDAGNERPELANARKMAGGSKATAR